MVQDEPRLLHARFQVQGFLQGVPGVRRLALLRQQHADVAVRLRSRQHLAERLQAGVGLALLAQRQAQVDRRPQVGMVHLQRLPEALLRLVQLAALVVVIAEVVEQVGVVRGDRQRLL